MIADINDYLAGCTESYDYIVNDVSEPLPGSPAREVFSAGADGAPCASA